MGNQLLDRKRETRRQFYEKSILGSIMETLKELLAFLRYRKKYWLWPIIILLVVIGTLVVLVEGSALAPFIYSLF